MKKNRIIFTICAVIFIIIFLEIIAYMNNGIKVSELNNMYKDIIILENKIALYYLDNGKIPIIEDNKIKFKNNSINPNDNDIYYEIDLGKLENLNLFYGDKYFGENDIYIINEQSHTIYYYKGFNYNGEQIYTRNIEYQKIDLENY